MSTVAFTAQSLGAGETSELRAILMRGLIVAALVGATLIALQFPLATLLLNAMGGSEGVTRAAKAYFIIRIWSSPVALGNYVVLGWLIGQARAKLALGMIKELKRRTARTLELQSLNPVQADRTLDADEVAWIARIVWASQ